MHDLLLVRVFHRFAHLDEQAQPRGQVEVSLSGVVEQVSALDVFHHQIRQAIVGAAAIEHAGDVRVFEAREDLALAPEAAKEIAAGHAALHDLDRHFLLEHIVTAARAVHAAHAAFADEADDLVLADARARAERGAKQPNGVAHGGRKMRRCVGVSGEPRIHLAPKLGIAFALRVEEQTAGGLLALERVMEERLDRPPALGIHD